MKSLILSTEAKKRRARLHPWIFSNEVQKAPDVEPGELVEIRYGSSNTECWTGYYNPHSLIAARVLADGLVEIDFEWITAKLRQALQYRVSLKLEREAYRLVNGEADGLPGLIVDCYGPAVVVQSLTAGMDRMLPQITEALAALLQPAGIIVRCDAPVRTLEGLDSWVRPVWGNLPDSVEVKCHSITFLVDVLEGQKTGLFLDQMENNQLLAGFARDQRCLDVCCYTGACSLQLSCAGAVEVWGVDVAGEAIQRAQENAVRNGFERIAFEVKDAFEILKDLCGQHERYGIVNLDPPAFAKRRKDVEGALRGYRELNRRAFKLVNGGGVLCTSTCSHHITRERFLEMLVLAARDAGRMARIIEIRAQAADHPALLSAPETAYLTCVVLRVD